MTGTDSVPGMKRIVCKAPTFTGRFVGTLIGEVTVIHIRSTGFGGPCSVLGGKCLRCNRAMRSVFMSVTGTMSFDTRGTPGERFREDVPSIHSTFRMVG